jgi:sugar phosphate isomerase/epimerase
MKILARTQMFSQYSILESLAVIKNLGFEGVEICMERQDWSLHALTKLPIAAIRSQLDTLGLATNSFSMHRDYVYDDEFFALMKAAIQLTPQLGTNIFVFADAKPKSDDAWERMIVRTRELVAVAEEIDVILAKEFEPDFIVGSTADMLRMFAEIPSPNLVANLDLGHVFICDPDPMAAIRQLGEKIVHVHIENMPAGVHDHLLPHEGDMDLLAYLDALTVVGFEGGMALDLYKYDYEAVAPEAIAYIRDLLN